MDLRDPVYKHLCELVPTYVYGYQRWDTIDGSAGVVFMCCFGGTAIR